MNILKIKRRIEEYLVDIDKKYEDIKKQKHDEIQDAIKVRREEDAKLTFDQAALDVLLKRAVEMETVAEIAKDLWLHLGIKK